MDFGGPNIECKVESAFFYLKLHVWRKSKNFQKLSY